MSVDQLSEFLPPSSRSPQAGVGPGSGHESQHLWGTHHAPGTSLVTGALLRAHSKQPRRKAGSPLVL